MRIAPLSVLLAVGLTACGGSTPPAATPAAPASQGEAVSRVGDVSIRANAMQTLALSSAVAGQYGIGRADNTVLLLVTVRQGPEAQEVALPARITATATDLRGRRQNIEMRELRTGAPGSGPEQALLDYIGTAEATPPDTLRFDVTVMRENGATSRMQFTRDFYPR